MAKKTASPGPVQSLHDLDRKDRRRVFAAVMVRITVTTVVMFTLYAVIPVNAVTKAETTVRFAGCLVLFFGVIVWQTRTIVVADRPELRAFEAVAMALIMLVVTFAYAYVAMSHIDPGSFTQPINRVDGVYLTTTILSTVGFGDITPVTRTARIVVTLQEVLDLVVIGVVIKVLFGTAETAIAKRSSDTDDAAPAD